MPEKSITEHLDRIGNAINGNSWETARAIGMESLTALRASIAEMERQKKAAEIVLCGYFEHRQAHDLQIVGAESARAVIAGLREQITALIVERAQARAALRSIYHANGNYIEGVHIQDYAGAALSSTTTPSDFVCDPEYSTGLPPLRPITTTQSGSPSIPTPSVEAEANRESARAVLARLANEDNWRMVNMESDDQTDYDAMAWSPLDCAMGEDGRVSDPLFHKPWKLAAFALSALPICDTPTERVTLAGLPDLGLSADQSIAKQEFE